MSTQNLLVELFVEELPPKALKNLGNAFASELWLKLADYSLVDRGQKVNLENENTYIVFASPRRLAVLIKNVASKAVDKNIFQKLMPVSVGLDASGNATPALIKRLISMGLNETVLSKLTKQMDGKSETLFIELTQTGVNLTEGLQIALQEAITKLPIPKVMTYQLADGWTSVKFVRPAHGLVALHGSEIIPVSALGLTAGNSTQGHRFEATVSPIIINNADSYAEQLKTEGAVIASFEERRNEITRQLSAAAGKLGLKPIEDDALLDEVTALVERPNVLVGEFEIEYLEVPQECLILTMKANQKYFPLLDNNKLTNKFLIVSNISPTDPSAVIGGNERVVRPRLADAKFFFDQDRKKPLQSRLESLNKVVYHNKLGSQAERTERVRAIAKAIGGQLGGDDLAAKADQAAQLAKADLVTDMVGEFPELQGIMGRYYAQHEGLDNDVAFAIEDHYKPRFAEDNLPRNLTGICVALADKLETLVGMFGIGNIPTGDKDPFALRRHALGVIGCIEALDISNEFGADFKVDITSWLDIALLQFKKFEVPQVTIDLVYDFILERRWNQLAPLFGIEIVGSVITIRPPINQIMKRVNAVLAFNKLLQAPALAAANKRVGNILKKVEGEVKAEVNTSLLQEPAEIALNEALSKVKPEADKLFEAGDYTASLKALAALKEPVDAFFDNVMVNADDPALKANRLGLLATLHAAMNRVADLSKLAS